MGQLQQSPTTTTTTLRLLLPRLKRNQSIFVNTSALIIPRCIPFVLPVDWLVQLFIFNGTLFFQTIEEQLSFCQCLSLCPRPRTVNEETAFEDGWINIDGFVQQIEDRCQLNMDRSRFIVNPLPFVKQLVKIRNNNNAFDNTCWNYSFQFIEKSFI